MLWRKAWWESRVRSGLGFALIGLYCVAVIIAAPSLLARPGFARLSYVQHVYGLFYQTVAPTIYLVLAMLLGLGGLKRERASGTLWFTLALPVTRFELVASRAVVGLLEVAILASIPAALIPTLSPIIAKVSYPAKDAIQFAVLFIPWGVISFSFGFLLSTFLSGEFTGITVCLLTLPVYRILAETALRSIPSAHPIYMMSGDRMPYLDPFTKSLRGPMPWSGLLLLAMAGIGFLGVAVWISLRDDFGGDHVS